MNIYYIYAYLRQSDSSPYYIGKGSGYRAFMSHRNVTTPKDKSKIVVMERNLTEIGALALERRYIRWYGKKCDGTGILSNRLDGGEVGNTTPRSKETREKMSKARKGIKRVPHSEETKQKLREKNLGRKLSEETRKKMSRPRKGPFRPRSEETIQNCRKKWELVKEQRKNHKLLHSVEYSGRKDKIWRSREFYDSLPPWDISITDNSFF